MRCCSCDARPNRRHERGQLPRGPMFFHELVKLNTIAVRRTERHAKSIAADEGFVARVAIGGLAYGLIPAGRADFAALGVLVLALMMSMEPWLGLRQRGEAWPAAAAATGTVPRRGTSPAP